MIYNEKYNRYIDNDFVIYRMNTKGKLVQVKPSINNCGYAFICYGYKQVVLVHRLMYETFKGPITDGFEVDHIDRNKLNNNPLNLRLLTHIDNMKNRKRIRTSEFGIKFHTHFNTTRTESPNLYFREWGYYKRHKKCRWE